MGKDSVLRGLLPSPVKYWSLSLNDRPSHIKNATGEDAQVEHEAEHLLTQSVTGQMMSDVPLGAFLSGGIDSSTIVALMQANSSDCVRTYTIGFHEDDFNEAPHARAVANYLGTDHTELYIIPEKIVDVIPELSNIYDEPFADCSQLPTVLLASLTSQHVTVCLSGDGGDELFCGYDRYASTSRVWNTMRKIPLPFRSGFASALKAWRPSNHDFLLRNIPVIKQKKNLGNKIDRLASIATANNPLDIYLRLISNQVCPNELVRGASEPMTIYTDMREWDASEDVRYKLMEMDLDIYLPDDILVKVDRAAMSNSLETRVPMLDHRLVEFAFSLPLEYKVRANKRKWILRKILYKYIPRELVERPKMGFDIPIGAWLRGPLRDWAEELLDERRMQDAGFIDSQLVQTMWKDHLTGRRDWQYPLWDVLMWESWYRNATSSC